MLVALDWLLLIRPLLDAGLVAPVDSGSIDSINVENNSNELHC